MAITNAEIIARESQRLLAEGKIKPTGRVITAVTPAGDTIQIPETEAIHTFLTWKAQGYKVRRGEHAVARFGIWKYTRGRQANPEADPDEQQRGYCFMKESCFFSASQVEPA